VTINNLGDRASIASVIIKYDPSFLKSVQDDWAIQGVISTIGVLLAAGAAVFLLSNLVNRPIMRLSKIVVRGDLKEISNLRANSRISEIRVLEDSLAVMGRQIIVLNERDAENFRNAAVGKITAQISHDLRAPLNFIERLMHIPDDRMIGEVKQDLKASIFRMNSMIESLRYTDIEAMIKPKQSYIDLSSVLALIKAKADQKSITIVDSLIEARNNSFWIDSSKFERAWINLASNAIDFASED
jgi:signal transduction histidine kinase